MRRPLCGTEIFVAFRQKMIYNYMHWGLFTQVLLFSEGFG